MTLRPAAEAGRAESAAGAWTTGLEAVAIDVARPDTAGDRTTVGATEGASRPTDLRRSASEGDLRTLAPAAAGRARLRWHDLQETEAASAVPSKVALLRPQAASRPLRE